MQHQPVALLLEPVIRRRPERRVELADGEEGEEVVVGQRLDVGLRQRLQLLAGELAVAVRVEALRGVGAEQLVERPDVTHGAEHALREDEFGRRGDPDMGMGRRRIGREGEAARGDRGQGE